MTQLFEINVNLSPNHKQNLAGAFHKRETIVLRLQKILCLEMIFYTFHQISWKDWKKSRRLRKEMDIKLSKTNIRKQVGGSGQLSLV